MRPSPKNAAAGQEVSYVIPSQQEVDPRWLDEGIFPKVARMAGVCDEEWHDVRDGLPAWPEHQELLKDLIRTSSRCPDILLCFGEELLHEYEGGMEMRWSSFRTVQTKEIIRGKNEAVDPSASLTAES